LQNNIKNILKLTLGILSFYLSVLNIYGQTKDCDSIKMLNYLNKLDSSGYVFDILNSEDANCFGSYLSDIHIKQNIHIYYLKYENRNNCLHCYLNNNNYTIFIINNNQIAENESLFYKAYNTAQYNNIDTQIYNEWCLKSQYKKKWKSVSKRIDSSFIQNNELLFLKKQKRKEFNYIKVKVNFSEVFKTESISELVIFDAKKGQNVKIKSTTKKIFLFSADENFEIMITLHIDDPCKCESLRYTYQIPVEPWDNSIW